LPCSIAHLALSAPKRCLGRLYREVSPCLSSEGKTPFRVKNIVETVFLANALLQHHSLVEFAFIEFQDGFESNALIFRTHLEFMTFSTTHLCALRVRLSMISEESIQIA
jgi:Trk-type K+ transport system membrane component